MSHRFCAWWAPQVLAGASTLLCVPAPAAAAARASVGVATVVAGGDVMLDRGVRAQIARRGSQAFFSGIAPVLRGADLAFANLECPLAKRSPRVARPGGRPVFRGDPALAPALRRAGFGVLSLANNHALDCGSAGLVETLRVLHSAHLTAIGAGGTTREALQPFVTRVRGLRVAWVAASAFAPAQDGRPAIARLEEAALLEQVRAVRSRAEAVIVSLHWGIEYRASPTPEQRTLARAVLAAGADVILGHHSHVPGPVEEVRLAGRRRLVAYSLGNLVFDPPRWEPRASESLLLRFVLGRDGVRSWRKVPLRIVRCRPQMAGSLTGTSTWGAL